MLPVFKNVRERYMAKITVLIVFVLGLLKHLENF